jgi:hypothetical protein
MVEKTLHVFITNCFYNVLMLVIGLTAVPARRTVRQKPTRGLLYARE